MREIAPGATRSLRDGSLAALICAGALVAFLASADLFFIREDNRLRGIWLAADGASPLLPYLAAVVYVTAFAAAIAAIVGVGELLTGNRAAPGWSEVLIASALGVLATGMGFWGLALRRPGIFVAVLIAVVLSAILTLLAGRRMARHASSGSPALLAAAAGTSLSLFLSAIVSVAHAVLARLTSADLVSALSFGGSGITELEVASAVALAGSLLAAIPVVRAVRRSR